MAFDASDPKYLTENCDYLHNVECGERSQLEPPISTPHCPRLYGIFPDEGKCDVFWNCWSGEPSRYQCSPGLAYDREARVCMWADQVPECKNEGMFNFLVQKTVVSYVKSINRSCRRIHLPSCWRNHKLWIILKTRSSRRLP